MAQMQPERCIETLREAVSEIAETMLFIEIGQGEAKHDRAEIIPEYSAVIGYSEAIKGSLHLSGSKSSVLKLACALLGEEREEMDDEMGDAFGEMANMVAGGVQSRLEGELGAIQMSPPVVISGQFDHQAVGGSFSCVSHLFDLEGETFFVEIFFRDTEDDEQEKSGGTAQESEQAALADQITSTFAPQVNAAAKESAKEMVRAFLPELAEKIVREEIQRIHAQERSVEIDAVHLTAAIREAFAPRVESMAREMVQQLVTEMLPNLAENMVSAEIEKIKTGT